MSDMDERTEQRTRLQKEIDRLTRRRATLRTRYERDDKALREAIESLRSEMPEKPRGARKLSAHAQAGHNAPKMAAVFERLGVATMKQAADEAGVVSGASTWSIKALVEDGLIEPTGRKIGRSPEFRFIGAKGETTLEPGQ